VQVPDSKDVASRAVPESCVTGREARGEALTGVRVGQPLSREILMSAPGADAVTEAEGNTGERAIASARSTRRGQRPWHARTPLEREPGDLQPGLAWETLHEGPRREGEEPQPTTYWEQKSDSPVVAVKPANNPGASGAESVEPRGGAKGNTEQSRTCRTQSRESVFQRLDRVRQAARQRKKEKFTALMHLVDVDLLRQAYFWLKRDAAAGVDGITWRQYGEALEDRLVDLHGRIHRNAFRETPSRRHYIPKADGRVRPLGIAALEDKIVQRALVEVLNAVYEEDFLGFSYGFRPGRSQHDALDALSVGITRTSVSWIVDADISRFFDTVSHEWLIKFAKHRIGDPRVIRLIGKWLKAGALEDGKLVATPEGTPQGAVISPLLANIYLHYVFDLWAQQWRQRHALGNVVIVRYADDIVVGTDKAADAKRFVQAMRARLEQFGLTLHPDKSRVIEFGRFAAENRAKRGLGRPQTFDFLGAARQSGCE
jgi:RNA-directed DNA polymerase